MADDQDTKIRPGSDNIVDDDPLAELARIIGYDRPAKGRSQIKAPETEPEADIFDLESELLRELDVPQPEPRPETRPETRPEGARAELSAVPGNVPGKDPFAGESARARPAPLSAPADGDADREGEMTPADAGDDAVWDSVFDEWDSELAFEPGDRPEEPEAASYSRLEEDEGEREEDPDDPAEISDDELFSELEDELDGRAVEDIDEMRIAELAGLAGGQSDGDDFADVPPQDALPDRGTRKHDGEPRGSFSGARQDRSTPVQAADDDHVLEDMARFELPSRGGVGASALSAGRQAAEITSLDDHRRDRQFSRPDESATAASRATPGQADAPAASMSATHFEDELSADLDIFRHEMEVSRAPSRMPEPDKAQGRSEFEDLESEFELAAGDFLAELVLDDDPADEDAARQIESGSRITADDGGDFISGSKADHDEMAEAFMDLVPGEKKNGSATAESSGRNDWHDAMDGGERNSPDEDEGFAFDATALGDTDETVEQITEFDLPAMPHDEPVPDLDLHDDFESEIEREFASLIEEDPQETRNGVAVHGAVAASPYSWDHSGQDGNGHIPDDYLDLEQGLETGNQEKDTVPGRYARPDAALSGSYGEMPYPLDPAGAVDDGEDRNAEARRGPMLALIMLGGALLVGVGIFGWSMFSGDDAATDGPRIIRADKEPVKIVPENPGGLNVPNQNKAVYDKVAGNDGALPDQSKLVTTAEEPVDIVQRTLSPDFLPLEGQEDPAVEPGTQKAEDRLTADGPETGAAAPPIVSPRKVRTMVVRPDGTIVTREEPEPAPAAQPQANGVEVAAAPPVADAAPAVPAAETPVAQTQAVENPPVDNQATGNETVAPVRVVKTQPIRQDVKAPLPEGRPADQPVNIVGTVTENGNVNAAPPAADQVATAPQEAAPAANPGGYYMQIASQPTAEGAQASYRNLSERYASLLKGYGVDIQQADIPGRGVFHRVRIPAGTREQANELCSRYKAAGGSCFVSK